MIAKLVTTGALGLQTLAVVRHGKLMAQYCPFQQETISDSPEPQHTRCGEWCPMFEVNSTDVQLKCSPRLTLFDLENTPPMPGWLEAQQ